MPSRHGRKFHNNLLDRKSGVKQCSKEFKEEALKQFDEIGVEKAVQQRGIAYYTLAD